MLAKLFKSRIDFACGLHEYDASIYALRGNGIIECAVKKGNRKFIIKV